MQTLKDTSTTYSSLLINEGHVLWTIVFIVYCFLVMKLVNQMRDVNGFKGKQKRDIDSKQTSKTFQDVGGNNRAKEAILEIIDYIKKPELFKEAGVRMPKGVLLYGPPGTGKTLIAKAAAQEAGIPVIYSSGSEFVEVFVGLGAKRIRELFT
jgi:cell division protease FtsH